MDNKYQHRRHNKNLLMAHIILVTKYRKKLFAGAFRDDTKQYLYETCVKHILLQYNPTDSITRIVSMLKQCSTYMAWKRHKMLLRRHYWKELTRYGQIVTLQLQSVRYHKP